MIVLTEGYGTQGDRWKVIERDAPGYSRVYYVTGGSVTYQDSNIQTTLEHGHLYVFPTILPYEMYQDKNDPLTCLWYHFDLFPAIVTQLTDITPEPSLCHLLNSLICELEEMTEPDADNYFTIPSILPENFHTALIRSLEAYIFERANINKPSSGTIEMIDAVRRSCFDRSFTIAAISERFGYTSEHFIRRFHSHLNVTPYQYVTLLRMTEAARLLLGSMPISEVASAVGYGDSKGFARAFSKRYGVSPSNFKRYYRPRA